MDLLTLGLTTRKACELGAKAYAKIILVGAPPNTLVEADSLMLLGLGLLERDDELPLTYPYSGSLPDAFVKRKKNDDEEPS